MKSSDWFIITACGIYLLLITSSIIKAKWKNSEFDVKKFLKTESIFIPDAFFFLVLVVKLAVKVF